MCGVAHGLSREKNMGYRVVIFPPGGGHVPSPKTSGLPCAYGHGAWAVVGCLGVRRDVGACDFEGSLLTIRRRLLHFTCGLATSQRRTGSLLRRASLGTLSGRSGFRPSAGFEN